MNVVFAPNHQTIIGGSDLSNIIHIWNVETGELLNEPQLNFSDVIQGGFQFNPSQPSLLALSRHFPSHPSSRIEIYDVQSLEVVGSSLSKQGTRTLDWMPSSEIVTHLDFSGSIHQWNIVIDETASYQLFLPEFAIEWSPDSQILALISQSHGQYESPIALWNITELGVNFTFPDADLIVYPFLAMDWVKWWNNSSQLIVYSSNHSFFDSLCWNASIEVWDVNTGNEIPTLESIYPWFMPHDICGNSGLPPPP